MALSVGQRYVRINESEVREALASLDVLVPHIDPDERIVGASFQSMDIPNVVIFIVERTDEKEKA